VISQESYIYDPVGNMTSKTVDGLVTTYGYDNADQLTAESRTGYSASYSYDGNGNRLAKVLNGVTEAYAYDDGDKLLTAGSKSYAYDLAGRTIQVDSPSGSTYCAYDDEGRLTAVTGAGPNQTYTYNGLDARRTKSGGGASNTYKRNGVGPTAPVINDGAAVYTPGISERRSGVSKWSHQDYLGSTKALTNSSETVTDTRQYDAFGLQTGSTGSSPTPFGFAGGWGYQSDETGLQLLGHRYYDPSTGRFLTRDPIKDGRNWYGYCENNPTRFVDPTGHLIWIVAAVLVFALVGSAQVADAPTINGNGLTAEEICAAQWDAALTAGLVPFVVEELFFIFKRSADAFAEGFASAQVRSAPATLEEQIVLQDAKNGGGREIMKGRINDPRYQYTHRKMQVSQDTWDGGSITIQYWEDRLTGVREGFKFKNSPIGTPPILSGPKLPTRIR
jgi:RHS repeat-associated protein